MKDETEMLEVRAKTLDGRWNEATLSELLMDHLAGILRVGRADIDPAKSFDYYGLDSIDAVIATASIGRQLAIELPPEFLFRNTTVNAVVRALLNGQNAECVAGSRHGEQVQIFLFPGGGGKDEPGLIRFRAHSPESLEFDVVNIGDWREWIEYNFDFEEIVERACRHIETVSPDGPLRLAGYSQGGQLAVATALALKSGGRAVSFVGLIDSGAQLTDPRPSVLKVMYAVLKKHLRPYVSARIRGARDVYYRGYLRVIILHLLWTIQHSALRRKVLSVTGRHMGVLVRARSSIRLDQFIRTRLFFEMWDGWVSRNGITRLRDVPVVLFRSQKLDDDLGWKAFCSDLRVVPIHGDHNTMFEAEHLDELTAKFVAAAAGELE